VLLEAVRSAVGHQRAAEDSPVAAEVSVAHQARGVVAHEAAVAARRLT
jgi:hypothetical protein